MLLLHSMQGAYDRSYGAQENAAARNAAAQNQAAQFGATAANQANQFNVGTQAQFAGFAPQAQSALGTGAGTLYDYGAAQRSVGQDIIDEDIKRFNYTQAQPGYTATTTSWSRCAAASSFI